MFLVAGSLRCETANAGTLVLSLAAFHVMTASSGTLLMSKIIYAYGIGPSTGVSGAFSHSSSGSEQVWICSRLMSPTCSCLLCLTVTKHHGFWTNLGLTGNSRHCPHPSHPSWGVSDVVGNLLIPARVDPNQRRLNPHSVSVGG